MEIIINNSYYFNLNATMWYTSDNVNRHYTIVDVAIHVDNIIKHVIKLSVEMSNYCNKSVLHIKWKSAGTISKFNRWIVETETKSIALTHLYMTAHSHCGIQAPQLKKVAGLN